MFAYSSRDARLLVTVLSGLIAISCAHSTQAKIEDKPAVHVQTEVIRMTSVTDQFESPGTVRAVTQTVLSSKIIGAIARLSVREGDRVRKGQLLVEIEGREASAQLRRAHAGESEAEQALEEVNGAIRAAEAAVQGAEANRDLALATHKRYELLRDRHSVSPQEFEEIDTRFRAATSDLERVQQNLAATRAKREQVLARIEQAKAEVESATVALNYSTIAAPFDGIVTAKKADVGMLASPGVPLLVIDDDSSYDLECVVEESHVSGVHIGQTVRTTIDALGASMEGKVRQIIPAIDPSTRTYVVKVSLPFTTDVRRQLRSGFYGRASFPAGQRETLIIPQSALVERGQLTGVYVVKDDVASLRLVKTGKKYEQGIEIVSGLSADTRIVTKPTPAISDGVTITDDNREGNGP